jgi:hypothetical protein
MRTWPTLALLLVAPALPAAGDEVESRLKAQFIERFTHFIDWPGRAAEDEPFVICVYGRDPLTDSLRELVRTQRVQERPARLTEISDPERCLGCQVLYVAGGAAAELPEILAETARRPILTIGDRAGFARRGVLINFFREDEYMRFEVNTEAVEKSGLRFGSQLLRLATLVEPDEAETGRARPDDSGTEP